VAAHHVRDEELAHRDARDRHPALRGRGREFARRAGLREELLPPDTTGARARNEDSENVQPGRPRAKRTPAGTLMAVNPNVFIVGCPRAGTTLLQRIVDAHRRWRRPSPRSTSLMSRGPGAEGSPFTTPSPS